MLERNDGFAPETRLVLVFTVGRGAVYEEKGGSAKVCSSGQDNVVKAGVKLLLRNSTGGNFCDGWQLTG
jgi:hypothetical protein